MVRIILMAGIVFILLMPQVSEAFTSPYPDPNRQTAWNNVTDAVHTFGKNSKQKKEALKKLHTARTKARVHSIYLANKAKKKAWQNSQQNSP